MLCWVMLCCFKNRSFILLAVEWHAPIRFEACSGSVLRRSLTWGAHECPGCWARGLPCPVQVTAPHILAFPWNVFLAHSRGVTLSCGQTEPDSETHLHISGPSLCGSFLQIPVRGPPSSLSHHMWETIPSFQSIPVPDWGSTQRLPPVSCPTCR